jgi:phage gpG-like protein
MAAGKEFQSYAELDAYLQRKAMAIRSLDYIQTAYPLICKFLESQTKKAFHNQATPSGRAWPALEHRRVRGTSGHVLRDTSELMVSVTASSGAGNIRRLDGTTIWFGTSLVKGFHNKGGMIQARASKFLTIPASLEALYCGGMRNFPRKLSIAWDEAKGKGIAYERVKIKQKQKKGGNKTGGGTRRKRRVSAWLQRMRKRIKRILNYFRKKTKKPKSNRAKKAKQALKKQRTTSIVVHYYLRKFVIIPERKFLEVTPDTTEKVGKIVLQEAIRHQGTVQ